MQELMFNDHQFERIERNGKVWMSAADIAKALGYSRSDKVSRIYAMHRIEFTDSMSIVIETPVSGFSGLTTQARLFSLRGAHLLAMFARTKKGVEFRRWILDIIDSLERQVIPQRSMLFELFEATAELHGQNKFASLCGKGLSQHKKVKPPLAQRVADLLEKMQPSLLPG
jgi:phage anti-repressor protein